MKSFFEGPNKRPPEVVEGILREGQIAAFGGTYGVGKSPFLDHLAVCVAKGKRFCSRETSRRRVIIFDLENDGDVWRGNIQRISQKLGVRLPRVPDDLDVYLAHDRTQSKRRRLSAFDIDDSDRIKLLESRLKKAPDSLVIIDPVELFFDFDKLKGRDVLRLYKRFRALSVDYPCAAFLLTFNLRKRDRRTRRANLLQEPRDWLDEVAGSMDIMNRSDVRIGMDFYDEDIRIINGVRRNEDFDPLLIKPVGEPKALAGFRRVKPGELNLARALTPRQREQWGVLPDRFRFEAVADKLVPRASLYRLINRAKSLRLLKQDDDGSYRKAGVFRKVWG